VVEKCQNAKVIMFLDIIVSKTNQNILWLSWMLDNRH